MLKHALLTLTAALPLGLAAVLPAPVHATTEQDTPQTITWTPDSPNATRRVVNGIHLVDYKHPDGSVTTVNGDRPLTVESTKAPDGSRETTYQPGLVSSSSLKALAAEPVVPHSQYEIMVAMGMPPERAAKWFSKDKLAVRPSVSNNGNASLLNRQGTGGDGGTVVDIIKTKAATTKVLYYEPPCEHHYNSDDDYTDLCITPVGYYFVKEGFQVTTMSANYVAKFADWWAPMNEIKAVGIVGHGGTWTKWSPTNTLRSECKPQTVSIGAAYKGVDFSISSTTEICATTSPLKRGANTFGAQWHGGHGGTKEERGGTFVGTTWHHKTSVIDLFASITQRH